MNCVWSAVLAVLLLALACSNGNTDQKPESKQATSSERVPTPTSTQEQGRHEPSPLIYAHYYGWYDSDKWEAEARTNDPSLGLYDSRDSSAVSQHIEWGKRAGITAFSVSWHGSGSVTDIQLKDYLKPAIEAQPTRDSELTFFVLFETPDILNVEHGKVIDFDEDFAFGMTRGDKFLQEFDYLADAYFGVAGYHKISERPVAFIYLMRDAINYQRYFDTLKTNMDSKGFDLYLIGDVMHWQEPVGGTTVPDSQPIDWPFLRNHFAAISGYNLYDPDRYPTDGLQERFLSDVKSHWFKYKNQADAFGLKFVPFILPGFDDRKLRGLDRPTLARGEGTFYRQHWGMAREFIDPTLPHVALTSFNEWHEGTEIEPSLQDGVSYLDLTSSLARKSDTAR